MKEEPDAVFDAHGAQFGCHGHQLVVMDPDEVVGLQQRQEGLGEGAVDARGRLRNPGG